MRLPEAAVERLPALARSPYETGAIEESRRRTGALGPAATVRVQAGEYDWVVRSHSATWSYGWARRHPDLAELEEDNRLLRLEAACGLALRNDPPTAEAIERVGPLGDASSTATGPAFSGGGGGRRRPRQPSDSRSARAPSSSGSK